MKKVLILFFSLLIITGCSKTVQVQNKAISADEVNEQVIDGDDVTRECIKEMISSNNFNNVAGASLLVTLKADMSFEKASSIIKSYGLSSPKSLTNNIIIVSVPKNKELMWTCLLRKDDNFKGVEINKSTSAPW